MIPKIIHYCWFGKGELPEKARKCIASWKRFCPDYELIQWNEDNYEIPGIPFLKKAYEDRKWSFVTDYVRLDVIHRMGGIYFDTDVELLKPIDELLSYQAYFGFEEAAAVNTGLGFGAEKHCDVLREMMRCYEQLLPCQTNEEYVQDTCPIVQTPILEKRGLLLNGKTQRLGAIMVFSAEYMNPRDFMTGRLQKTENTISIHWYDASWQSLADQKVQELRHKLTPLFGAKNAWRIAVLIQYLRYKGVKETLRYYREKH